MTNDDMDLSDSDIASLAGLYAIGALEGTDLRRFERYLSENPAALDEVDEFRETAARLASLSATEPPADLRNDVLSKLGDVRQLPPAVPRRGRGQRPLSTVVLGVAAAIAVLVAGFVGYSLRGTRQEPRGVADVLSADDTRVGMMEGSSDLQAGVIYSVSQGQAVVVANNLPAAPAGNVYQLWRIRDERPVAAGTLPAGRRQTPISGSIRSGDIVAVTVEPSPGSEAPTTPVLLSARL